MQQTIRNKLLLIMLAISLVPLVVIGYIAISETQKLGYSTADEARNIGNRSVTDATTALNSLGEEMIKRIALDVKKQVEIYLKAHPDMTITDLQSDPDFKSIIVQSVGKTGYTTGMDSKTLINRFHSNEKTIGTDYNSISSSNPDFYAILKKGENGSDSSGYYPWKDADGVTREKFGYYVCSNVTTADGIQLRIGATTYIDEFSLPVKGIETRIGEEINRTTGVINGRTTEVNGIIIIVTILTMILVIIIGYIFARTISNPIRKITDHAERLSRGDTGSIVLEKTNTVEIDELNNAFSIMQESLAGKALAASAIAKGNLSVEIPVTSPEDTLGNAMVTMRTAISRLTTDINTLVIHACQGSLSSRADPDQYEGEFQKIVMEINALFDAVVKPLNEAIRLTGRYADNSFVDRFDQSIQVSGDFARFRESLDHLGDQISKTLNLISDRIITLNAGTQEAEASIRSVTSGAEKVVEHIRIVNDNSRKGEESVAEILKTIEDLSVAVSDISVKAERVSGLANTTNTLSSQGEALARTAESGMAGINNSTEQLDLTIRSIRDQMAEIGEAVSIITDIADQTNLLALNAAIEAARAGDAGLGFAVVANEVKDLASQSRLSAEKIREMITRLKDQSEQAASVMNDANHQVKDGIDAVSRTLAVFNEIVVSVDEISGKITDVAAASEEQAASVEEVTAIIYEVLQMIRETAEQAAESVIITRDSSIAISGVSQVMISVNTVAEDLATEIQKFDT